jgi:hypothetical protein
LLARLESITWAQLGKVNKFFKGQDELEVAAEDLEEDDLLVSSQKSRRKNKNSSERSNAFDVVGC